MNSANVPLFTIVVEVIQLILLAFHVLVLACVLRQRGNGTSGFRSGFFTIYIVQSVADIVDYIIVSWL